jgi:hypothetical protein
MNALRENINATDIGPKHFEKAIAAIKGTLALKKSREVQAGYS